MSGKGQGEDRRYLTHDMPRVRRCKGCGVEFAATPTQYYCASCRKEIHRRELIKERVCVECGCRFEGGPNAPRCPVCRERHKKRMSEEYNQRRRARKVRKVGGIANCLLCGKPYKIENGNQKYCPECKGKNTLAKKNEYSKAHAKKNRAARDVRREGTDVCYWCGKSYTKGKHTFACSDECAEMLKKYFRKARAYRKGQRKEPPEPPPFMPNVKIEPNGSGTKVPIINLRKMRTEANITQKRLAEMIGTDQARISMWEGGRLMPPDDKVVALAEALGCSVEELMRRPEE